MLNVAACVCAEAVVLNVTVMEVAGTVFDNVGFVKPVVGTALVKVKVS